MKASRDILEEMDARGEFGSGSPVKPNEVRGMKNERGDFRVPFCLLLNAPTPPTPQILAQAHERVKASDVVGSSTACMLLFDNEAHQIQFSNLGDSGIIVLRHIDSDVAGVLKRDRVVKREER